MTFGYKDKNLAVDVDCKLADHFGSLYAQATVDTAAPC